MCFKAGSVHFVELLVFLREINCWNSFQTRRYGFLFNDDDEAALFGRKVMNQLFGDRGYLTTYHNDIYTLIYNRTIQEESKQQNRYYRQI